MAPNARVTGAAITYNSRIKESSSERGYPRTSKMIIGRYATTVAVVRPMRYFRSLNGIHGIKLRKRLPDDALRSNNGLSAGRVGAAFLITYRLILFNIFATRFFCDSLSRPSTRRLIIASNLFLLSPLINISAFSMYIGN